VNEYIENGHFSLMPVRQKGEKLYVWYSICSRHKHFNYECELCKNGTWHETIITDYGKDILDFKADERS
jgi:hypothetical protein